MKHSIYIVILLITCISNTDSFAQKTIADSIISITDTTQRFAYLNSISEQYSNKNNLDSAALFATEALRLAQIVQDVKGEANALYHIGEVYTTKGKYKKALAHFLRSLKLKRQVKDKSFSVSLYYRMANVFA
ncbi:MAG: tetratricopeptide repeat protein, partial [Bacteroidota bacterium]